VPVLEAELLSTTAGWILTSGGLKLTEDAGDSWKDIDPLIGDGAIKGVFFLDVNTGWVVAARGGGGNSSADLLVYRTTDGGANWTESKLGAVDLDSRGAPAFIYFLDSAHGWIVIKLVTGSNFSLGRLFVTTDGGSSWSEGTIPIGAPVVFVDSKRGWTAGGPAGDQFFSTQDGGQTWVAEAIVAPADFATSYPIYSVPRFSDGRRGVLPVTFTGPASGVAFYETSDAGERWQVRETASVTPPLNIGASIPADVIDFDIRVALPADGSRLLASTERHDRLAEISPNGLPAGIVDVDFATREVGWAVAHSGACPRELKAGCTVLRQLLMTVDGGQTWVVVDITG
jgi:photosystem II stability/assembly factor-like uncharacterized protein